MDGGKKAKKRCVREAYMALVHDDHFIRRVLLHMVNHRVQDFADPLTYTLVLMATAPMQMVLCESGLLPFKTNLLPVVPYSLLLATERQQLHGLIDGLREQQLYETIESNGQYTLTVLPFTQNLGSSASVLHLCKRQLLIGFVDLMMRGSEPAVNSALCNIVLQRFWSRVSTPSETVSVVMEHLARRSGGAETV